MTFCLPRNKANGMMKSRVIRSQKFMVLGDS